MSTGICPLHDEHVDPDTGHCDHCTRAARLDCDTLDLDQHDGPMFPEHP